MKGPTPKDRVIAALRMEPQDRPPVCIFTQSATTDLMTLSDAPWPKAHKDPATMARLASAQADILGFESVRTPFDVTAEAERLGCTVDLGQEDRSPIVVDSPFSFDPMDGGCLPEGLPSPGEFVSTGRTTTVIESIGLLSRTHGDDYPIVAGVTGPLTSLGQIIGTENMVMGTLMCPDAVVAWTDRLSGLFIEYAQCISDAGADVIQMSEASGSPDLIDPAMFDTLTGNSLHSLPSIKGSYTTLHICGNALPVVENMIRTGVDAISLESAIDPRAATTAVAGRCALIGNVGAVFPLMTGSPEETAESARSCIEAGFDIIAPGCGVPLSTPTENLRAMVAAVKSR